jgi:hypothetical protein
MFILFAQEAILKSVQVVPGFIVIAGPVCPARLVTPVAPAH